MLHGSGGDQYTDRAKIIGPLSRQLYFVRSGLADVIVIDEQCIRTDIPEQASKVGSALIATCDKPVTVWKTVSTRK